MVRSKLMIIVVLIGLLLVQIFGSTGSSVQAQELLPPEPMLPFKEPFPVEREVPFSDTTLDANAPEASGVRTNVLGTGDGNIHGLIYRDGFLWACTRTTPAHILKISPATLSVVARADLTLNYAEDILTVDHDQNGNYYLWVVLRTVPARVVRVNPVDMTMDITELTGMNSGTSLLYAFGKLWVGGSNRIVEVDISDPDNPTFIVHDFTSLRMRDYVVSASIRSDQSYLYVAFLQGAFSEPDGFIGTTITRLDPGNPTVGYLTQYVSNDHPDDMVFTDGYLFTSGEDEPNPSVAYRFPSTLTPYITITVATNASYGMFYTSTDPESLWGAYVGSPGIVNKLDFGLDVTWTFSLPSGFDSPSEIAFDNAGNMYLSTWQNPSGIIEYTIPDAVTLSINKSGNDAVLSWTNSDSLVDHYEVWRSTNPYFNPGDVGSTRVDVAATVGAMSYTDAGALGDVNTNYYYVVRAFNDFGLLAPISNRVGEFAIPIVPNWNLLSWPLIPFDISLDNLLGTQLYGTEDPTTADRILLWNEVTQAYQSAWFCGGPVCQSWGEPYYNHWLATDYSQSTLTLPADDGFWVQNRSGNNEVLVIVGGVSETGRTVQVGSSWQMLGSAFPSARNLDAANITATGTEDPQTADRILYWNQTTQTYQSAWLCGGPICETWGEPYYNHWLALDYSLSNISIQPGRGFWLQNRHGPFSWVYPP
jgi:hypothetical protein